MEAVKRLPMISFELKNSPEPTLFHNLKQCIAKYYQEDESPDSYSEEFRKLEELRGRSVRPRVDVDCCSEVKRYYAQLHSLQNRFPLSSESDVLEFTWKDIYSGSLWRSSNIKYEQASILYNIAALHSKLGIEEERTDPESMKIACTYFQCAAWAFGEIKNQYAYVLKGDLSAELMIFMQQICFAQAQECILEKSLADNRKAAIIAKVTAQVISFYNAGLSALFSQTEEGTMQDLIGNKFYKEWLKYIKFKTSYLSSILFLYQGMNSEEQRKMGERVALYNAACEKLEEAKKESKGMNKLDVITEALTFATDIIEGKRKNAKQENEFIYHEGIPDISTIAAVQGANLVQGIPFDVTDPQVIGEDIFKRLVPMKAHEHLSLYSEQKANILRKLGAIIDDRDSELASFMGSLNTESLNAMGQSQERLPQGLVDRCAEISAKPNAIADLVESMSNLADICCDVEMTLKDIKSYLDDDAKQEQSYQKQMGKRPTGHMAELNREYTKYFEAHNKAGESNDTLRKAMELHVSNLKVLAQPLSALKKQIPQADPIDDATRKELTTLLAKVEEMKNQRDGLFNDLREQILNKDDITPQLIAHGEKDIEELFEKELKKYSLSVSIIEQNLVAQGNILKALTDTYAKHAMTLKSYNDTKLKREQFYSSLIASFDVYEDLMSKSAKGLDFYKKLHGNVQKLMSRVKGARDVQEEERQTMLRNAMPKAPPVDSIKAIDSSFKSMMASVPSSGGGGPKLKDYLKSGMVPGMGGLRDDLNKLPGVRPSPVGQENVSAPHPASCPSMNYPSKYRNQQQNYQQPAAINPYSAQQQSPYYPQNDQLSARSGSASLSSSSTSLNTDYYNQGSGYGMTGAGAQGYVNPIYQGGQQNYPDVSSGFSSPMPTNNYATPTYQQQQQPSMPAIGTNQYDNYAATYGAQQQQVTSVGQQFDYYKNQVHQPSLDSSQPQSMAYNPIATNHSYSNTTNVQQPPAYVDQSQNMHTNQYQTPQQYPVAQSPSQPQQTIQNQVQPQQHQQYASPQAQTYADLQAQPLQNPYAPSPVQQYPVAPSPNLSQYSGVPQPAPSPNVSQYSGAPQQQFSSPNTAPLQNQAPTSISQSPAPTTDQQYSTAYTPNSQQSTQNLNMSQNQNTSLPTYDTQQSYYNYNNSNQAYSNMNQYGQFGEQFVQQNYSGYQPVVNTANSYMTAQDTQAGQPLTMQPTNYNQGLEIVSHANAHKNKSESPFHQPNAIPTYTTAVNAAATNNSETVMIQSQQQISSYVENQPPAVVVPAVVAQPIVTPTVIAPAVIAKPIKSENIDLLSGIDFTMSNPTIENIPTLTPQSAAKPVEDPPKKILTPVAPMVVTPAPVKLNHDLADLDFSLPAPEPVKVEVEKPKLLGDPFEDAIVLKQFHKEVEGLEKFTEILTVKTLNGVTPLANKWKELQDLLVKDESNRSVAVARLFPDKNRSIDCLPYDHARVHLPTATDNYINAVLVKNCGPASFILAQTPMANTANDYWEMVWSQKANTLVCLHSTNELLDPFWPQNINDEKTYGEVSVLQVKQFEFSHCHEKLLKVTRQGSDTVMNISLLQIKAWKKNSADQVLDVAGNVITSIKQQNFADKQLHSPIILNCISGAERSGLVSLGITTVLATQMRKPTLLNVVDHWFRICSQRKGALEDEQFIQLSLEIVLTNAHRILNRRGIMTSYQMKNADKISAAAETEKSALDGLDSLDPFWKFK